MGFLNKIDLRQVLMDHVRSMTDDETGKFSKSDFALFYGVPAVFGLAAPWFLPTSAPFLPALISSVSIFTALLLNMLVLTFNVSREPERYRYPKDQAELVQQVQGSIGYTIVLGLIYVLIALIRLGTAGSEHLSELPILLLGGVDYAFSFVLLGLLLHFVLVLLMVLHRVTVMIQLHADDQAREVDPENISDVTNAAGEIEWD